MSATQKDREHKFNKTQLTKTQSTLSAPCISESSVKIKFNVSFYFYTSLWCLKRFYEGLLHLYKIF